VVRYEDLTTDPQATLERVYGFLGLEYCVPAVAVRDGVNAKYHLAWQQDRKKLITGLYCQQLEARFGPRMASLGYAFPGDNTSDDAARTWLPASVASGISWIYRGSGGVRRMGSRVYKQVRKRVRTACGITRTRRSAVHG
jgi:hypothetical protein